MPSFKNLAKVSVSLTALSSSTPEAIAITSPAGNQLLGYFSGWTGTLQLPAKGCKVPADVSLFAQLTSFTSEPETITCDWVKKQVEVYVEFDDVYEESFLQGMKNILTTRYVFKC